jgi:hypothetical protein
MEGAKYIYKYTHSVNGIIDYNRVTLNRKHSDRPPKLGLQYK